LTDRAIERFFNIARKLPLQQRSILMTLYDQLANARQDLHAVPLFKGISALIDFFGRVGRSGLTAEDYRVLTAIRDMSIEVKRRKAEEAIVKRSREMGRLAWKGKGRLTEKEFIAEWKSAKGKSPQKVLAGKFKGSATAYYQRALRLKQRGLL